MKNYLRKRGFKKLSIFALICILIFLSLTVTFADSEEDMPIDRVLKISHSTNNKIKDFKSNNFHYATKH